MPIVKGCRELALCWGRGVVGSWAAALSASEEVARVIMHERMGVASMGLASVLKRLLDCSGNVEYPQSIPLESNSCIALYLTPPLPAHTSTHAAPMTRLQVGLSLS